MALSMDVSGDLAIDNAEDCVIEVSGADGGANATATDRCRATARICLDLDDIIFSLLSLFGR